MVSKSGHTVTIKEWVERVGIGQAVAAMIQQGLSPSTADKIASDRYASELRKKSVEAIRSAIRSSGFQPDEKLKAS